MRVLKKFLITVGIFCLGISLTHQIINATEMNVDVGIEFTEVEPEPEPPKKPDPPIIKPKPTILPRTGEASGGINLLVGSMMVLGASILIWKKKKGVNH